jgi:hypothetical protein
VTERQVTEDELRAAARKQIRLLTHSGQLVANGDPDEAVRLAASLRVLLHDTAASHSILGQLGWKTRLQYVNSLRQLEIMPGMTVSLGADTGESVGEAFGLVVLTNDATGALRYMVPLDRDPVTATLPFEQWWKDKALCSQGKPTFSRWDLVDAMAHRDAGAHSETSATRASVRRRVTYVT